MTSDDARAFCDDLQARVTQLGERTGEGFHLGRCLAVIRTLAAQIDAPPPAPVVDAPKKRGRPAADNTPPRLDE